MKKTGAVFTVSIVAVLLFAQCSKECGTVYNARFYTSQSRDRLFLYIDDAYQAELPYMATAPQCGQTYSDDQRPYLTQLKSGEYKLEGKDEHGVVRSSSIIRFDKKSSYLGGGFGGASFSTSGDCAIIDIFE